jgi:uncharacterized protein
VLAKYAVRPRLSYVLWRGYARGPVNELVAGVRHELGPVPVGSFALKSWAKQAPVDAGPAAAPLHSGWLGYARGDVDFWRRALAGTLDRVTARQLATHWITTAMAVLVPAAVLAAIDPAVLAIALTAYLAVVTPLVGFRRYRTVAYRLRVAPERRAATLLGSSFAKWIFVGVLAILGTAASRGGSAIFLVAPQLDLASREYLLFGVVTAAASTFLVYRLRSKTVASSPVIAWQLRHFSALLPRTPADRAAFAVTSITAGVVEEMLYRGFGIAVVIWAMPHASNLQIIWITAVAFGVAHVYQGVFGLVSTTITGAFLAWVTLQTGSIVPAMILHAMIDLRFCFVPAEYVDAL